MNLFIRLCGLKLLPRPYVIYHGRVGGGTVARSDGVRRCGDENASHRVLLAEITVMPVASDRLAESEDKGCDGQPNQYV